MQSALSQWKACLLAVQPVLLKLARSEACSVEELQAFESAVDAWVGQASTLAAAPSMLQTLLQLDAKTMQLQTTELPNAAVAAVSGPAAAWLAPKLC